MVYGLVFSISENDIGSSGCRLAQHFLFGTLSAKYFVKIISPLPKDTQLVYLGGIYTSLGLNVSWKIGHKMADCIIFPSTKTAVELALDFIHRPLNVFYQ